MKTLGTLIIALTAIIAGISALSARQLKPDELSDEMRRKYDYSIKLLEQIEPMRDSVNQVYRGIESRQSDHYAIIQEQKRVLAELEAGDVAWYTAECLRQWSLSDSCDSPAEFRRLALKIINCMGPGPALRIIESNLDKASPFLYNWLALRAMEAEDYVKAYRYFISGIRKMSEPGESVYNPLFHNLGMFLSRTTPYIRPEQVKSTQAAFDNNRNLCVEQYAIAVPFLIKDYDITTYSIYEYLTPAGPYHPGLVQANRLSVASRDGLINGTTLAKEYEHYNFWTKRSAAQKSPKSGNRPYSLSPTPH